MPCFSSPTVLKDLKCQWSDISYFAKVYVQINSASKEMQNRPEILQHFSYYHRRCSSSHIMTVKQPTKIIHYNLAKELKAFSVSVKSQKMFLWHSSQKIWKITQSLCFLCNYVSSFGHFGMIILFFMRQIFLKVDLDDNR